MGGGVRHRWPLIGVAGPARQHHISWNFIKLSLWLAGARMVRLTPANPQYGMNIDGLIVSGGKDVDPLLYGKERKANYHYDPARDALEMEWIFRALKEKIPLLGICRGMQMINVCLKGTLYMDIRLVCETARYPDSVWSRTFARKPVVVKEGSLLYQLLGREVVMVNSLHRQSLGIIGEGLLLTAWEENGIVQAVEGGDAAQFLLGVQWHPEFMPGSARQRRIFSHFVEVARKR